MGSQACSLLNCPLEIREQIYIYAIDLEPTVCITNKWILEDRPNDSLVLLREEAREDTESILQRMLVPENNPGLNLVQFFRTCLAGEGNFDLFRAGFNVPGRTALRGVNKRIRDEVETMLKRLKVASAARDWAAALIYGTPITAEATRLCQQIRIDLLGWDFHCIPWLLSLTPWLASCIRSLVLGLECVAVHYLGCLGYWTDLRDGLSTWVQIMRKKLTEVKELAVSLNLRIFEMHYGSVPSQLYEMLEDGAIDTLRFLLDERVEDPASHELFTKHLGHELRVASSQIRAMGSPCQVEPLQAIRAREEARYKVDGPRFELEVEYLAAATPGEQKSQASSLWPGALYPGAVTVIRLSRRRHEPSHI